MLLPAAAALLFGLLLLFPSLNNVREFKIDITRPAKGELEKLHIQNTTFYITDKSNRVNNFTADNLDETSPGSKLIKLTNPKGIIPTSDDTWIDIQSPTGYFDQNANTLKLQDDVEMIYSDGMTVNVPDMVFDFTAAKGFSDKPVRARGHLGDFQQPGRGSALRLRNPSAVLFGAGAGSAPDGLRGGGRGFGALLQPGNIHPAERGNGMDRQQHPVLCPDRTCGGTGVLVHHPDLGRHGKAGGKI